MCHLTSRKFYCTFMREWEWNKQITMKFYCESYLTSKMLWKWARAPPHPDYNLNTIALGHRRCISRWVIILVEDYSNAGMKHTRCFFIERPLSIERLCWQWLENCHMLPDQRWKICKYSFAGGQVSGLEQRLQALPVETEAEDFVLQWHLSERMKKAEAEAFSPYAKL